MKGLKGIDPEQEAPSDLVVLIAIVGWVAFLVGVMSIAIDRLYNLTWFTG